MEMNGQTISSIKIYARQFSTQRSSIPSWDASPHVWAQAVI